MRAIKLITVSTVAVLMGGASLAIGQEGAGSLQGGNSMLEDTTLSQGSARGSETEGSNPRAAENPMRRSETSGERGSKVQRSRALQRGQAMTAERGRTIAGERGRAIAGERGLALTAERGRATTGQGTKASEQTQRQLGSRLRQSFGQAEPGLVNARASERNAGAGLNAEQRARLREILAARRDIPRVSNLADVRINAVIPRSVRLAAIPEEVVRIYPRFRRHQAFIYRNEMVVVDPLTSRIVAVLPA
jgi:pyruvate/2-oxoglutarate dehydrogenase complex dihydrolipoamide acyltransferase (E2) component